MKAFWSKEINELYHELDSTEQGLASAQAKERLGKFGANSLSEHEKQSAWKVFLAQFKSPISLILIFATLISVVVGDTIDAIIIGIIILLSSLLSFYQEYSAGNAMEDLLNIVKVSTQVLRDGAKADIALEDVVPGDIVFLKTGDLVPADGRLLASNDIMIDESTLTGETFPIEKHVTTLDEETELSKRDNALWMGTHVTSGSGTVLIVNTGEETEFGKISKSIKQRTALTEFETGVHRFGYLLVEITFTIIFIIFAINVFLKKSVLDSFMFSLALAVGLTPQLLPAIISVNLAHGAKQMSEHKVIVKKLNSIENFGSMDILCSDKTGTITQGKVVLHGVSNLNQTDEPELLQLAYLNASLQTGFLNPIDEAIIQSAEANELIHKKEDYQLLDEKPYSFQTRRLSVAVGFSDGNKQIITKGALEDILAISTQARLADGSLAPIATAKEEIEKTFKTFSNQGLRTLGLAYKQLGESEAITFDHDMTFAGFITLEDPLKVDIKETIQKLRELSVELKIITGDNVHVAQYIAQSLEIDPSLVMTGAELKALSSSALAVKVPQISIFAEVEPNQKEQIVQAIKKSGKVVGYMGDGINDAPALHSADVSISVDTATDVAKDAANIVLLEADLNVLVDGIIAGRKTFANTLKYIFMATSANFGNMFSMAGASLFLPYLPLLPKQVLLTNLLTDFPEMQIVYDGVDPDMVNKPHRFNLDFIKKFMFTFGLISSIFDYTTFGVLLYFLHANEALFQTFWFTESILSATLIVLVVRTQNPLYKSRPQWKLSLATLVSILVTLALPYLPFAKALGFTTMPLIAYVYIAGIVLAYLITAEVAKHYFYKHVRM